MDWSVEIHHSSHSISCSNKEVVVAQEVRKKRIFDKRGDEPMETFVLYGLGAAVLCGIFALWKYSGTVDSYRLSNDPYLFAGCEPFKKGRAAWAWRMMQCMVFRAHYVKPEAVLAHFEIQHPHIRIGAFVKLKDGTRYKLTRPGSFVYILEVRMDERSLRGSPRDLLEPAHIYAVHADRRGHILEEENLIFLAEDLEKLSLEEQARIDTEYKKPILDPTPFPDGQIVEVLQDSLLVHYAGMMTQTWSISEPLKGIVDVADSQYGGDLNSINQAHSRPPMMKIRGAWRVYNFATRAVYKKEEIPRAHVRRALCGPEYQVFIPRLKKYITVDRAQIRKREYDKDMLSRVVLSQEMHTKLIAWAPPKSESVKKLEEWGVGSGLLQGKSNIMLFSGPLGVGKTLLAEALAEYLEMPFYPFDAVEAGTAPEILEDSLRQVADRAKRWGALVLWDEAEIYLENRHEADRGSNALVAVTLRYLESFEGGMLVIATNRPFLIDEGINSRIPVKIAFPPMTKEKRKELWLAHVPKEMALDTETLRDEDLERLAEAQIDGRQIRNAVLLAARRAVSENLERVPARYLLEAAEQIRKDAKDLREIKFEDWEKKRIDITKNRKTNSPA
jgi:DNA polymerase III delta prime subunit